MFSLLTKNKLNAELKDAKEHDGTYGGYAKEVKV